MPTVLDRLAWTAMTMSGYQPAQIPTPAGQLSALVWEEDEAPLPPLTVLHGFGSAGVHQVLVVRRLKHRVRRLVLPDLPGHGFSDAPRPLTPELVDAGVRTALSELQPEPAVVMGSSFGGLAAVRYTLAHPERVRGLLLVSPLGAPMTLEEREPILRLLRARSLDDARQFLDRVTGRAARRNWIMAPEMKRILSRPPLQDLIDHALASPLLTMEELRRIQVPVTVIWGRHEQLFPEHQLEFWGQLPDVTILRPENSAHSPSISEPEWFERTVEGFLEQLGDLPVNVMPG